MGGCNCGGGIVHHYSCPCRQYPSCPACKAARGVALAEVDMEAAMFYETFRRLQAKLDANPNATTITFALARKIAEPEDPTPTTGGRP